MTPISNTIMADIKQSLASLRVVYAKIINKISPELELQVSEHSAFSQLLLFPGHHESRTHQYRLT